MSKIVGKVVEDRRMLKIVGKAVDDGSEGR